MYKQKLNNSANNWFHSSTTLPTRLWKLTFLRVARRLSLLRFPHKVWGHKTKFAFTDLQGKELLSLWVLRKDINGNLLLRIVQSLESFFTLSSQEARLIFVTQLILSSSSQHFLMVIQIFLLDIGCFSPHLQHSPCAWPLSCLQSYLTLT